MSYKHYTVPFRALVASGFVIFLGACGPVMQTVTDYTPPITDSGMHCVERANQDRASCDSDNQIAYNQCTERAAVDADLAFLHAKEEYTKNLEFYIRENERYEHAYHSYDEQTTLIIHDGELEYIRCSEDVKMQRVSEYPQCKKFLKQAKKRADKLRMPIAPVKPYPPNRNAIFNQFHSACNYTEKNCKEAFNWSYRSCGGTVTNRQVCVSNCEE